MQRFKQWNILNEFTPESPEEAVQIALDNRGLKTKKEKKEFLNPPNPDDINIKETGISKKEVDKAIVRLKTAKAENQKIVIYGDYDADGVSATAVLWEALSASGFSVMPFVPSRFEDGYGLSEAGIKKIIDTHKDVKLIITVDNGIVAHKAIKFARSKHIDIIVTDHHQKDNQKLQAVSVIHSTKVSGSGVAWFFAREVISKFKGKINSGDLLDLVAIGTVADQLPLLGINRSLVKFGIERLTKTKRIGLKALYKMAAISPQDVDTYRIGFMIAPMINAAGRLGDATDALRLLCTRDSSRAHKLALTLRQLNLERQSVVADALVVARRQTREEKILVISHEEFHEGVIGLAASKLVEIFYRPSIVISTKGAIAKASARSIPGFNIIDAIRGVQDLILEGGGHEMAAGFSITPGNIDKFRSEINKKFSGLITDEMMFNKLNIDFSANFSLLNKGLHDALVKLAPYGAGNPSVLVASSNCEIISARNVGGEGKHLKAYCKQGDTKIDAIGFGLGGFIDQIDKTRKFDLAYSVDLNEWQGKKSIQLKLKDIKYTDESSERTYKTS